MSRDQESGRYSKGIVHHLRQVDLSVTSLSLRLRPVDLYISVQLFESLHSYMSSSWLLIRKVCDNKDMIGASLATKSRLHRHNHHLN